MTQARISDFQPDPSNANRGTERGRALLESSLRQYGAGRSILVDKNGRIIAGNKTLETAGAIGLDDVIVVQTDGTKIVAVQRMDLDLANDEAARMLAYADNRVGQIDLDFDPEQLLADMTAGLPLDALWRQDELDALLAEIMPAPAPVDAEPQVNRADELQQVWQTSLGQMWLLDSGKGHPHRLICGDCTDAAIVARVMGGEKADMVFTDPPYNVSYQANESTESLKARNRRTDGLIVQNDAMSDDDFDAFLDSFLIQMPLKAGGAYYLCAPPGRTETQFRNALDRVPGLALRECIVWVKDQFVFGRQDYHWRHESILYGWKEGESHYFVDDRTQDTVWEIPRPRTSEFHPTMKPVELPSKAIANSSRPGGIVYDPFAGSGTTGIACESLGRQARLCELDAGYCAVILQRFQDATNGHTPALMDS